MYRESLRDLLDLLGIYFQEPTGISAALPFYLVIVYLLIKNNHYHKRIKIVKKILFFIPIYEVVVFGKKRIPYTLLYFYVPVFIYLAITHQFEISFGKNWDLWAEYNILKDRYYLTSTIFLWLPVQLYLPRFIWKELGIGNKAMQRKRKIYRKGPFYIRDPLYVYMFIGYYFLITAFFVGCEIYLLRGKGIL